MSDELVLEESGGRVSVGRRRRALDLHVSGRRAGFEIELAAGYGTVLSELGRGVQERVAGALAKMCGLDVEAVDMSIDGLDEG